MAKSPLPRRKTVSKAKAKPKVAAAEADAAPRKKPAAKAQRGPVAAGAAGSVLPRAPNGRFIQPGASAMGGTADTKTVRKTVCKTGGTTDCATPSAPDAALSAVPAAITAAKPKDLVQRVYNTINGELSKLENQTGASSQDRERASRALSQMVNSLEKAVEMQRVIAKDKTSGSAAKDKEALKYAEDLRREIAERLERLNLKRGTGKRSE